MDLTRADVDQLVRLFRSKPTADIYFDINKWYENNVQHYIDQEYMICIYLFLLGANIQHRYTNFTYEKHMQWIADIRNTIERADSLVKMQRLAYLEFGTKSGQ
jgi:hypothetical protein